MVIRLKTCPTNSIPSTLAINLEWISTINNIIFTLTLPMIKENCYVVLNVMHWDSSLVSMFLTLQRLGCHGAHSQLTTKTISKPQPRYSGEVIWAISLHMSLIPRASRTLICTYSHSTCTCFSILTIYQQRFVNINHNQIQHLISDIYIQLIIQVQKYHCAGR